MTHLPLVYCRALATIIFVSQFNFFAISRRDILRRWMTLNMQDTTDDHNSKCSCSCPMESRLVRRNHDLGHKILSQQTSYDFVKTMCCSEEEIWLELEIKHPKKYLEGEVVLQILRFSFLVLKAFVTDFFICGSPCNVCPRHPWRAFQENKSSVITTVFPSLILMYELRHSMP